MDLYKNYSCHDLISALDQTQNVRFEASDSFEKSYSESKKIRKEGNKLYIKNGLDSQMEALSLYSQSIAYAPRKSDELCYGYGNRSVILFHMKKYKECLIDLYKVFPIPTSPLLKAKLSARETLCFKLMNKSNGAKETEKTDGESFEKIELPKNSSKKVSHFSESLSLKCSQESGKHVIANQDINCGEIIAVEKAFISYPLINKLYLVCSYCLCQVLNVVPCDRCAGVIYCSEKCKKQAYDEYHSLECSLVLLKTRFQIKEPVTEISQVIHKAAVRFFIKIMKSFSGKDTIQVVRESG